MTGSTDDFRAIKPELGLIIDLENLVKAAKEKDQQIFLELDPNHSSVDHPWFKRSVEREEPFASYYVWADGVSSDGGKERRSPPNNWVSRTRILSREIPRKVVSNTRTIAVERVR